MTKELLDVEINETYQKFFTNYIMDRIVQVVRPDYSKSIKETNQ
jgi:hypothetical protein